MDKRGRLINRPLAVAEPNVRSAACLSSFTPRVHAQLPFARGQEPRAQWIQEEDESSRHNINEASGQHEYG